MFLYDRCQMPFACNNCFGHVPKVHSHYTRNSTLYLRIFAGVTGDSSIPKAIRETNKSIPGPKIPIERIRETKEIDSPSCKQIPGGPKFTSIRYFYNNIILYN